MGHKTASVVTAAAFGEPAFPVDTYIAWPTVGVVERKECGADRARLKRLFPREEGTRSTFASSSLVESVARHSTMTRRHVQSVAGRGYFTPQG